LRWPLLVSEAKLYFRYGAMMSAKTMNLLAIAHAYEMLLAFNLRVFVMLGICSQSGTYVQLSTEAIKEGADSKLQCRSAAFKKSCQVLVMKPKLDTRFGSSCVQSRCGLKREADRIYR